MAIGHLDVRAHSRSQGHSVAAAIAYRFGTDVTDTYSSREHEYARRSDAGEVGPRGFCHGATAPAWDPDDPQAFADALENAERRVNSIVCRDITIALPVELTIAEMEALTRGMSQQISDEYDAPTAWALHAAEGRGDQQNIHAHILMSTRALDPETGWPGKKLRQFHVRSRPAARANDSANEQARTDQGGSEEIRKLRARWEQTCNAHLSNAGRTERIAMGTVRDARDRRPVLTHGEVTAERIRWSKRHTGEPVAKLSVRELVATNQAEGGCQTQRGRELAEYDLAHHAREQAHGGYHPIAMPDLEPGEIETALDATQKLQPITVPQTPTTPPKRAERPRRRRRRRRVPSAAKAVPARTERAHLTAPSPGPQLARATAPLTRTKAQPMPRGTTSPAPRPSAPILTLMRPDREHTHTAPQAPRPTPAPAASQVLPVGTAPRLTRAPEPTHQRRSYGVARAVRYVGQALRALPARIVSVLRRALPARTAVAHPARSIPAQAHTTGPVQPLDLVSAEARIAELTHELDAALERRQPTNRRQAETAAAQEAQTSLDWWPGVDDEIRTMQHAEIDRYLEQARARAEREAREAREARPKDPLRPEPGRDLDL